MSCKRLDGTTVPLCGSVDQMGGPNNRRASQDRAIGFVRLGCRGAKQESVAHESRET